MNKSGLVLMGRIHPGETVSSWMMKGAINFLISENENAKFLRNNFVIKIVPMINVDGVICGNFRTSSVGVDLNRRWMDPSPLYHPEIFFLKEMILRMSQERAIDLIIDLHGHSGQYNIFIYGNKIKEHPRACKVYPFILSKTNPSFFYSSCKFNMQKFKRSTARISLFNEIPGPLHNIVCVEASSAGCKAGPYKGCHWDTNMLEDMGRDLFIGFIGYMESTNHKFIKRPLPVNIIEDEIAEEEKKLLEEEKTKDHKVDSDSEDPGSDSSPSEDNLEESFVKNLMPVIKKKKKVTKKKKYFFSSKNNTRTTIKKKDNATIPKLKKELNAAPILRENNNIQKTEPKKKSTINAKRKIFIDDTKVMSEVESIHNNKRNSGTQTEEIFFKYHWSHFINKYKIINAQKEKKVIELNYKNAVANYFANPDQTRHTMKKFKPPREIHQQVVYPKLSNFELGISNVSPEHKTNSNFLKSQYPYYKT